MNAGRLLLILLLVVPGLLGAEPFGQSANQSTTAFDSGTPRFLPVEQAYRLTPAWLDGKLLLHWQIAPGYYLYRDRFAATADGEPLALTFPQGEIQDDPYFGRVEVFYDEVELTASATPSQPFVLAVTSQGCADAGLCYPPQTERWQANPAAGTLEPLPPVGDSSPAGGTEAAGAPRPVGQPGWLMMAIAAFVGGALLNLMPCVFPVLSLKALSFQQSRASALPQGLSYTAGVVVSFVTLAGILLALRATGLALGWGFQLQQPAFVGALAYLFVALGLSLSGLWSLGTSWMGAGQRWTEHSGLLGSFATGVLAVVVASPCTAPLMGAAMGYALLQPTVPALGLFAALGLGMAMPLLMLSASPALLRSLPRPGPWMERFKQALAFPLYASAIWLLWVIGRQAGPNAMALVLLGCLLVALAIWLASLRRAGKVVAIAVLALAVGLLAGGELSKRASVTPNAALETTGAIAYTAATLAELRATGTPVLLNVTADWCLTCLANERVALATDTVQSALQAQGFIYMVADWTHYDPAITDLLASFGRGGVPLYVVFRPGDEPEVLGQVLTPGIVTKALQLDSAR